MVTDLTVKQSFEIIHCSPVWGFWFDMVSTVTFDRAFALHFRLNIDAAEPD